MKFISITILVFLTLHINAKESLNLTLICEGTAIKLFNKGGHKTASEDKIKRSIVIKNGVISGQYSKGKKLISAEKIEGTYFGDDGSWGILAIDRVSGSISENTYKKLIDGTLVASGYEGYCKSSKPKF